VYSPGFRFAPPWAIDGRAFGAEAIAASGSPLNLMPLGEGRGGQR
jgi:hypothetical protein